VISTAFDVVFPSPLILEGHELIDVYLLAIDKKLFLGVNSLGKIVKCRTGGRCVATRHGMKWVIF
jgi:hypothetical protein